MSAGNRLADFSTRRPRTVTSLMVLVTVVIGLLASLPSIPGVLDALHEITVDTDPENMLSEDEPVRVFHNRMKDTFALHDMVVVGVVNEEHPEGVFNAESLRKIAELTAFAKTLRGEAIGEQTGEGVIPGDVLSLSTVDSVTPVGERGVKLDWLMKPVPDTQAAALEVRRQAMRVPFLADTIVSEDGKAAAIYIPLSRKDLSYRVYSRLKERIAGWDGPEQFHITGLPVAEDVFGVEMFIQMAISAPAAMVVIFLLMLVFFRKLVIVISPMIVAMVSVIFTMGSLIVAGFPVHIMSSMIPIFIMPIAVLDSIHIISEFFEKYQATRDRRATMIAVMEELFTPMLYTSLTSAAGFASLALTPIPPVQVFGVFVAMGIMVAWLLTVMFIPAFVMFIPARRLENFGAVHAGDDDPGARTAMGRFLRWTGSWTYRRAKPILAAAVVVLVFAGWGMSKINVNDNPVMWFTESHEIRVADRVLNKHFGGTYMAYLTLHAGETKYEANSLAAEIADAAEQRNERIQQALDALVEAAGEIDAERADEAFFEELRGRLNPDRTTATAEQLGVWDASEKLLTAEGNRLAGEDERPALAEYLPQLRERKQRFAAAIDEQFQALAKHLDAVAEERPEGREAFFARLEDRLAGREDSEEPDPARPAPAPADPDGSGGGPGAGPSLPGGLAGGSGDQDGDGPSLPGGLGADDGQPAGPTAASRPSRDLLEILAGDVSGTFVADRAELAWVFKQPQYLRRIERLQREMLDTGVVGKSNSLVDIVKTINRDLNGGDPNYAVIPNNRKAVAECIDQFTSGHRPDDLDHFVTPDWRRASVWVQLKSGDNDDMSAVAAKVDSAEPRTVAARGLEEDWFGLTYINVVWQEKMVTGMLEAFAGSFLVVFLLMTLLFRSALWGLLCMIPLTVTISAIYGAIGWVGKDYDMPVAVLSSLTLGLAVDFAIHFLARSRAMRAETGSWQQTAPRVFAEPARAILRNIIVIAAGFLPLLLAPLVPYKTVGVLLATILLFSGLGTLLILPALIRLLERMLFPERPIVGLTCNCLTCLFAAIALAGVVVLNGYRYLHMGFNGLAAVAVGIVLTVSGLCCIGSRRRNCRAEDRPAGPEEQ